MTPGVKVSIDDKALSAAIARLVRHMPAGSDARPVMTAVARALKTGVRLRFKTQRGPDGSPWKKTHRGGHILRLTGRLNDSISTEATSNTAAVGTNVIYGPIHHFGGVIRAKNKRFLAIPVGAQALKTAREGGGPKHHPGVLSFARSGKGQAMLVAGPKGGAEYLLKRSVSIPARPFLGLSADDREEILDVVEGLVKRDWRP